MDSIEYYGGGEDLILAETTYWLKTIGDWREACQVFTDNLRCSLQRTEQFINTGPNPRPITISLSSIFKHSSEHTFASYLDAWKEFDDESSPYTKLARLTDEKQRSINDRIKNAWETHERYERDVLKHREVYQRLMHELQELKNKVPKDGTKTCRKKQHLMELKSKMKMALVKYRQAYKAEYDNRAVTSQRLTEIYSSWHIKERHNLKLLAETLHMFEKIIFNLASEGLRPNLRPRADITILRRRERVDYIKRLYEAARRIRYFLPYEGPRYTNPILMREVMAHRANREQENTSGRVIQSGWGPFKTYVCLTPSAIGILENSEDYTDDDESEPGSAELQGNSVASLVSRLENVRLVTSKYHLKNEPRELTLTPGTVVIQVRSANRKGMSYGYKRGMLGLRKYGYYPADVVSLT